jgi:hypothetical protein
MGFPFSADFSEAIAGYPKGALIPNSDYTGQWLNLNNGNRSSLNPLRALIPGGFLWGIWNFYYFVSVKFQCYAIFGAGIKGPPDSYRFADREYQYDFPRLDEVMDY